MKKLIENGADVYFQDRVGIFAIIKKPNFGILKMYLINKLQIIYNGLLPMTEIVFTANRELLS